MRLIKSIPIALLGKAIIILCALTVSIIIARFLGPEGKGIIAVLMVISGVVLQFGNLGIPAANVYFSARESHLLPKIATNSFWFGIIAGIIAPLVALFCYKIFRNLVLGNIDPRLLIITMLSIPFAFVALLFEYIVLGRQKIAAFSLIGIGRQICFIFVTVFVLIFLKKGILELVIAQVVANFILSSICIGYVRRLAVFARSFDLKLFFEMLRYGKKAYLASFLGFLIIRIDLLVVNYFLGAEAAGVYSVDANFADMLCLFPATIGMLLFSRISSSVDKGEVTQKLCRHLIPIMLLVCLGVGLFAKYLIPLLYGKMFIGAVVPLYWLLPGIFFLGIGTLFMQDLSGRGLPSIVYLSPALALIVNIVLNIILIPLFHIKGAAIASSVSYALMTGLTMRYFLKSTKNSMVDTIFIKQKDINYLMNEIRRNLKNL